MFCDICHCTETVLKGKDCCGYGLKILYILGSATFLGLVDHHSTYTESFAIAHTVTWKAFAHFGICYVGKNGLRGLQQ